jgi:DNA replication protein DnaC
VTDSPGTGKTHLCTALGVAGITRHGKRVRFYSTVDLVNALERGNRCLPGVLGYKLEP